jgi:hypothetical protein
VTRELGRVGGGQAGRLAGRWAGGFVAALLLSIATAAAAFQQPVRPVTTTVVPRTAAPAATATPAAAAPKTYDECLRSYVGRTSAATYCRRLFPETPPAATTPSTTAPTGTTSTADTPSTPTREPVDITPQLNKLIDAWRNRPQTPPKPPADPLAVIPEIQAACASYVSVPERWRRCTADAWRTAGLRGRPPLVLQNPPVVAPPPVVEPPPVQPPPVVSKPPVQTPPVLTPKTVEPEPVLEPDLPPVAVIEPPPAPKPPPVVVAPPVAPQAPPPTSPATPIWFWLVALAVAAGGGFGVAKLLSRARAPSSRPSKVAPAPCPEIALVADPGVVVLTPDGPPRAGMAVSLRFETAVETGEVKLDYPTLETAP